MPEGFFPSALSFKSYMVPSSSPPIFSEKPKRVDLPVRLAPARPTGLGAAPILTPPEVAPLGAETLAGAGGAKEGTVLGVERARISELSSTSVGTTSVSMAIGSDSGSGVGSSGEGGASASAPPSPPTSWLVKMARGLPPLKMTTLPPTKRRRKCTAIAIRKGVEVISAAKATNFFFPGFFSAGAGLLGLATGGTTTPYRQEDQESSRSQGCPKFFGGEPEGWYGEVVPR